MEMKFIRNFLIRICILFLFVIAVVLLFDPFFQYHKPLPGLKAVLADKEYQVTGTLRNFDYDSLIVGSSVTENNNNTWFDEAFDCTTIKAIRSYGATADLCYLLDEAYETHELKHVFYNIDPSALTADTNTTYELTGCPMYLYDHNYFNDIEYVLNKSVLFEKIPYLLAQSLMTDYDEGNSYNWAQWKSFNSDMALGLYIRRPQVADMKEETCYQEQLDGNISILTTVIATHPETDFKIFISPYSMLWWDNLYRDGDTESYLYNMEQAVSTLMTYDNVEIYYFQNDEAIITNLENYMDNIHFSPDINYYICEEMAAGRHKLTPDNYQTEMNDMRTLAYHIVDDLMEQYVDRIKVDTAVE